MLNSILNVNCLDGFKGIEDESVDLIIADPPYFKVIGEKWDYAWRTEAEYIDWCRTWFVEVDRCLRKGGSFYIFGYFRMLSYLLPILEDMGLSLRQQIIVNKGMKAVSGRATKNYKMFPNVTESILFMVKDSKPFVKDLLKSRQKELGYTSKQINEGLGVKSNGGGMWSIYTGNNICKQMPTYDIWKKLETVLDFSYPYEKIAITFNPQLGFTDVWDDIDFYKERKTRIHPTQKPLELIDRLVLASSNPSDEVLDPFMGSGTTAVSCILNDRSYIGFELDKDYYDLSTERLEKYTHSLF